MQKISLTNNNQQTIEVSKMGIIDIETEAKPIMHPLKKIKKVRFFNKEDPLEQKKMQCSQIID